MSTKLLINSYLDKSLLLQIATSVNNIPWICTVCFAYDSESNLYWFSRHNTRHSQEIIQNSYVAAAVALPYEIGDKSRGLQISGKAGELHSVSELTVGLAAMQKRYGVKNKRLNQLKREIMSQAANYGFYCLRPDTIILHDALNFPDSPRQAYTITNEVEEKEMVQLHGLKHQ